ncbi:MAG: hypothetical protein NZ656_08540 [Nitrospinaceae bacterium]|nr:hypothetical protein [Nitrospinaceae bacterium]
MAIFAQFFQQGTDVKKVTVYPKHKKNHESCNEPKWYRKIETDHQPRKKDKKQQREGILHEIFQDRLRLFVFS